MLMVVDVVAFLLAAASDMIRRHLLAVAACTVGRPFVVVVRASCSWDAYPCHEACWLVGQGFARG